MMDVKYIDLIGRDTIKNLVGIPAVGHHANLGRPEARRALAGHRAMWATTRRMRCSTAGATVG
jgi:hypothetical protein